ncbi:hypothetical protein EJB05_03589 [Eragrostis curvula]|uniref:Uncharacterized protein n=1 Tax=Eragrostis curvula TaxID=38414 RepID=A0A5J9W8A7_9POAL|nr:hypothetical protein EJB05_03589 [Eragrostis curvula]
MPLMTSGLREVSYQRWRKNSRQARSWSTEPPPGLSEPGRAINGKDDGSDSEASDVRAEEPKERVQLPERQRGLFLSLLTPHSLDFMASTVEYVRSVEETDVLVISKEWRQVARRVGAESLLFFCRYLLVLDDVWNEDDDNWAKLKTCLGYGDAGSAILVTTRSKGVARLMSTGTYHDIVVLDRKFIKEIIEIRAFSSQKNKPVGLVDLVDEMANKCFGSPLAAKALGAVLRNKTTVEEWKAVSQRSVICSDENKILPILKLSYDDLPANMKQCFAFCAVFPKDYEIDVDMLIQLWMAIGFIPEQDELCTEGKQIFREMVSRSFFQDVKEVRVDEGERMERYCSRYKRTICKIHDLMHDVALSCVAITNESNSITELLTNTTRHLHFTTFKATAILNASMKEMSLAIQTLLCDYRDLNEDLQHVSKYSSLRALKLNVSSSFPMRPKHLHHLRNLDLSRSDIKALPEDISIMYNLQTLNLSDCCYLVRLPKQMRYMTALRHLYIRGCMALKCMPPELGRLNSLKTLTNFVAGIGSDCSNLGELRHLNIGGSLVLNQLENVTEADAKVANLGDKKELRELSLIWTRRETWEISDTEDEHSKTEEHSEIEEQHSRNKVLEGLKSPHGLQALRIVSYQGTTFPTWMGFLQNMIEMLPPLCQVPALQVLYLKQLEKLQCLYSAAGGTSFTFPKLKELTMIGLQNFEVWCETSWECKDEIIFPDLEKLTIYVCPKLIALPNGALATKSCGQDSSMAHTAFPSLKILELKDLDTFQRWEAAEATQGRHISFPELESLSILGCPKLTALPEAPLLGGLYGRVNTTARTSFPALKTLLLGYLGSFHGWEAVDTPEERHIIFPRLERLSIMGCPKLIALPAVTLLGASFGYDDITPHSAFPELKELELDGLESFKRWGVTEGTNGERSSFPKLERADIVECPELTIVPEAPNLSPQPQP